MWIFLNSKQLLIFTKKYPASFRAAWLMTQKIYQILHDIRAGELITIDKEGRGKCDCISSHHRLIASILVLWLVNTTSPNQRVEVTNK